MRVEETQYVRRAGVLKKYWRTSLTERGAWKGGEKRIPEKSTV